MMQRMVFLLLFISTSCFGSENLELLISPEDIAQKIAEVASIIDAEYQDTELTVLMVMKGAVCVTADLIRQLHVPVKLDYIKASSYGLNGANSGELTILGLDRLNLESKDVLVVDDIFDTGKTMAGIVDQLKGKNPKSLKTLVLVKKNVQHKTTYRPDFILFEIENRFVVGYGLDYKEYFRGLPGVYAFVNDQPSF